MLFASGVAVTHRTLAPVDLVIIAVFSLAIFYWAQAVKLPREEHARLVAAQAAGDAPV